MTALVYYVDPDATGGADGTTWADAYTTLNAAETARAKDLVAAGDSVTFYVRSSGGTADTAVCTIGADWTTGAGNDITVDQETNDPHNGVWDATAYRLEGNGAGGNGQLNIEVDYVTVNGLQIRNTSTAGGSEVIRSYLSPANVTLNRCLIRFASNKGVNSVANVNSCIIYGSTDIAAIGLYMSYNQTYTWKNNTVSLAGATSIAYSDGGNNWQVNLTNCYGDANVCYSVATHASSTTTKCASSDTTGDTGLQSIAANTTQFTNVTGGSEDFHLAGVGSALYHASDTVGATLDIDGEAFHATTPSIGADEIDGGAPATSDDLVIGQLAWR